MSEQQETSGGFAKAFVPGLVLGLVVGAFVGATLPPLLSGKKLPDRNPGSASPSESREQELMRDEGGMVEELPLDDSAIEEPDQPGTPEDAGEPVETPAEPEENLPPDDDSGGDDEGGGG